MELFLNVLRFGAIGLALFLFAWVKREERRRERAEFWVETLSAGRLRGEDDDWAAVYHEREKWMFFSGKMIPNDRGVLYILYVPSEQSWAQTVPHWMANKREIVLERIRQELKTHKYWVCRIEETEA